MAQRQGQKKGNSNLQNLVTFFRKDKRVWVSWDPNNKQMIMGITDENGATTAIKLEVAEVALLKELFERAVKEALDGLYIPF